MNAKRRTNLCLLTGVFGAFFAAFTLSADPPRTTTKGTVPAEQPDGPKRVTTAEARERSKLLHNAYSATLDVMHHRYFRRDGAVLPARAMEEVFAEMEKQSNIKAGWISVNTKAMSINHEPKSDFEKQAVKAITAGKSEFELVEKGYFRRAGAIPLGAGCVSCHTGLFSNAPQTDRFAALVISVPISEK